MPDACNSNARTASAMTAAATSADEFDVNAFAALETVHGAVLTDSLTDDALVANEISHAVFSLMKSLPPLLLLMHLLSMQPQMLLRGYRRLCEMACRSSTRLSANE